MLKVYNKDVLQKNQRFIQAILYGLPVSISLGIVYGLVTELIHIEFSAAFVLIGYVIGLTIQKFGRGVQLKFSILGAVLAVISFLIGDLVFLFGFDVFFNGFFFQAIIYRIQTLASTNINSLLALLFRVLGVYYAYITSRIV